MDDHPPGADNNTPTRPARPPELREHDRVPVNREFECIDEYIAEYVSDISHGGVFIRSKNPLAIGTRVTLRFSVIIDDFEVIEGEGEVVHIETREGFSGMGVAFTRLTAESKALIDQAVARGQGESG